MSPPNKSANLSKTLYTRGLQCHKSLYLHKYRPDVKRHAILTHFWSEPLPVDR